MAERHWLRRLVVAVLAGLGLAGCVPATTPAPVTATAPTKPPVIAEAPKTATAPANARQIAVTKLLSKIPRGERLGSVGAAPGCIATPPLTWQRGLDEPIVGQELGTVRDELKRAGYKVAGRSGALFEDATMEPAELLLAGSVKRVSLNSCRLAQGVESDSSVEVEWELYETRTRSVILTTTTRGTARGAPANAYLGAYGAAVRSLLAQEGFTSAVVRSPSRSPAAEYPSLVLAVVTVRPSERTPDLLQHDQSAVVRIPRGTGHGSGVIVAGAGWVLTAAHVVAGLGPAIDIELANGERVSGSVLRSNPVADVALIQLPKGAYPAAPMGLSAPLKVGDPVFAIGAPLHERFSRTVTKGVVSAFRPTDGRTLIQSDAIIHAGSSGGPLLDQYGRVVGLAQSGAVIGGQIGVGLNQFLAIDDVWRLLQVEPQVSIVEVGVLLMR